MPADTAPPLDVLLVEDDEALRHVLTLHLTADGCTVRATGNGEDALSLCAERLPEVAVLDIMVPGRSGLEVCAALRATYDPSPGVVMVTARGAEADVIAGFDWGADDYVIKPCRPREVVARVRAVARRVRRGGSLPEVEPRGVMHAGLHVDPARLEATVDGRAVKLTVTEFALLALFVREPGRVHPRMELLERVWDSTVEGYARNVDCHVARLRRKLEGAGLRPMPIATVHGVGYRFVEPPAR